MSEQEPDPIDDTFSLAQWDRVLALGKMINDHGRRVGGEVAPGAKRPGDGSTAAELDEYLEQHPHKFEDNDQEE